MEATLRAVAGNTDALAFGAIFAAFVAVSYFFVALDRQRADSVTKDDKQVGLKLVLFALVLTGVNLAAGGVISFLAYILGGAKGGSGPIRTAIPSVVVGAGVVIAIYKAMLPRTNATTHRQPERYMLGVIGLQYGVVAIIGVHGLLSGLFLEASWAVISAGVASTVVSGAVAWLAISRFGALSGWTMPARPAAPPPMQFPPQAGNPPGGGMPPAGGGYGQPGGGYPPQGGGYPPQGGGYAPPGGGYPPQGGGGGYPPR